MKEAISPGLRGLGLKGSGGRHALPSDECWALASLQKSGYSDAAEVQFTLNLLVVSKVAWSAMRGERRDLTERPSAGTRYGAPVEQARIGSLTPDGADKWWRVTDSVDLEAVADDVLRDVVLYALPWMRAKLAEATHP